MFCLSICHSKKAASFGKWSIIGFVAIFTEQLNLRFLPRIYGNDEVNKRKKMFLDCKSFALCI